MIDGVQLKQLTTRADERGFFREIIRASDEFFSEGFGQWSHSMMYTGTVKAWHIHQKQTDYFYCPIGVIKVALCKIDWKSGSSYLEAIEGYKTFGVYPEVFEFLLGDNQPAQVLRIPPGVAHGLKVLQGPAHLFYITSAEYDGSDEGRIAYNALGYDWFRQEIK